MPLHPSVSNLVRQGRLQVAGIPRNTMTDEGWQEASCHPEQWPAPALPRASARRTNGASRSGASETQPHSQEWGRSWGASSGSRWSTGIVSQGTCLHDPIHAETSGSRTNYSAIEVLLGLPLPAVRVRGARPHGKWTEPRSSGSWFAMISSRHREVAVEAANVTARCTCDGVLGELGVKGAEGRRSRLETGSITFHSARTVSRTDSTDPHRTSRSVACHGELGRAPLARRDVRGNPEPRRQASHQGLRARCFGPRVRMRLSH